MAIVVFVAAMALSFACMAGPAGSLPLAMIARWLCNFLMPKALLAKGVVP